MILACVDVTDSRHLAMHLVAEHVVYQAISNVFCQIGGTHLAAQAMWNATSYMLPSCLNLGCKYHVRYQRHSVRLFAFLTYLTLQISWRQETSSPGSLLLFWLRQLHWLRVQQLRQLLNDRV